MDELWMPGPVNYLAIWRIDGAKGHYFTSIQPLLKGLSCGVQRRYDRDTATWMRKISTLILFELVDAQVPLSSASLQAV